MEKLSIIIPVYNGENTVTELLMDLSGLKNIAHEVIVVDDGSVDATKAAVQKICVSNKYIRLVTKENGGVSSARNKGISVATGQYLMFLDADDRIDSNKLEQFFFEVVNAGADYNFTGYKEINFKTGEEKDVAPIGQGKFKFKEFTNVFFKNLTINLISYPVNKIFLKSIIDEHSLVFDENISFAEDLIFNLDYLSYVNNIYISDANYYIYQKFINEDSLSSKFNMNFWIARKQAYIKLSELEKRIEPKADFTILKNTYANNVIIYTSRQIVNQNKKISSRCKDLTVFVEDKHLQKLVQQEAKLTKSQKKLLKQLQKKRVYSVYLFWKAFEFKDFLHRYYKSNK